MVKETKKEQPRCAVCGGYADVREGGALCECCRESLALCDMENYLVRKAACRAGAGVRRAAQMP